MPKIVDHEERRERIVTAVCDQVLDGGFEAVTLRKVADRAGISMGQVQHYFATREAMIQASLAQVSTRLSATIEARIAAVESPTAERALRELCLGLLGIDPEGRRWIRLSAVILGRAVSDPATAELLAAEGDELTALTAGLIDAARTERGQPPALRPDADAQLCWAVSTSLGMEVALGHRSGDEAGELVDFHLERVLTAPGRSPRP